MATRPPTSQGASSSTDARHAAQQDSLRAGRWQTASARRWGAGTPLVGSEARQPHGEGRLAFGMKVIAWSRNLTEDRAAEVGVVRVSKERLFAEADVASLHLILSDRSRGIVGAADLARMKRTAYIVNTSRGPLIDQDALIAALKEGRIAGAGLDVFDTEPLPQANRSSSARTRC